MIHSRCLLKSNLVDYGSPRETTAVEDRARRQLVAIRSSLSFRLGLLLTNSMKRPWLILILPFTMFHLFWIFGMERLGKSKSLNVQGALTSSTTKNRDCVILFPTNGVGMGHFSRMFCLAKSIKKKSTI